jgi:YD repeat-containing protein
MLKADEVLGRIAYGGSDDLTQLGLDGLGIHTLSELFPRRYAENPGQHGAGRVYLLPSRISLRAAENHQLAFDSARLEVRVDPLGPAEAEFSERVTNALPLLMETSAGAAFRDLLEAAKIGAVFVWLTDHSVPFDVDIATVPINRMFTPIDAARSRDVPIAALRPVLPLNRYDRDGLIEVYDDAGRVSRLSHDSNGRLWRVQRKDGAVLQVIYDPVGEPQAIVIRSEVAACGERSGRTYFADRVNPKWVGESYAGFEANSATRYTYDVDCNELFRIVTKNFIAEAHPTFLQFGQP